MRRFFGSAWSASFGIAALVVFLQFVPVISFFLCGFFGAAYWSVLFVNAGFIFMAVDGFTRPSQRSLLIWPAIWFGGYLVIAGISHLLAHQFYAQIDRDNGVQKAHWNPAMDAIVLSHSWSDENRGVAFTADQLVSAYPVDIAFEGPVTPPPGLPVSQNGSSSYRGVKIAIGDCPAGAMNQGPDGTRVVRTLPRFKTQFASNLCISNREAPPPASMIRFVNGGIQSIDLILDRDVELITVTGSHGETYELKAAWTRPLTWFPMPIIGCDWPGFTQKPIWCGVRFSRESALDTGRTPERVITSTLGLRKVPLEKRFPALRWESPLR